MQGIRSRLVTREPLFDFTFVTAAHLGRPLKVNPQLEPWTVVPFLLKRKRKWRVLGDADVIKHGVSCFFLCF